MVAKQREQFRLKQQRSRARQAQAQGGVSAAVATMSTSILKLDRTRSLSTSLTELAQPKKQFSKSSVLLTAGHSDMKGLLCTDPALADVMPWHLQHETRQLAAQQRLTKQRARTAALPNSSSKQQQQRPHSAAAAVAYRHTMFAKSSTEKHENSDVEICSQSSSDTDNISYWMSRIEHTPDFEGSEIDDDVVVADVVFCIAHRNTLSGGNVTAAIGVRTQVLENY
eukprot:9118-Heterococcus_DN1.PRE.1